MNDLLPPRTHNQPPLDDVLPEESAELRQRAELLVSRAEKAIATETAQASTLLAGMMQEHMALLDKTRDERMRPYLNATRTVNAHYNAIIGTIATLDAKGKVVGGPLFKVRSSLDEYRRKQEAAAEEERRRLEKEARKQREAAEAADHARREAEERERLAAEEAQRKIREAEEAARQANSAAAREKAQREAAEARATQEREAAAARERQMEAELEQRRRQEEANRLERQAMQTTAAPVTTAYGVKSGRRTVWTVKITDLTKAITHARKVNTTAVQACVQQIFEAQVRAGVRTLPGAEVVEDSATTIRTR